MENIPIKALLRINNIGIMQKHKHIWKADRLNWCSTSLLHRVEHNTHHPCALDEKSIFGYFDATELNEEHHMGIEN